MGVVFEEDKAKGQAFIADFVEGSAAEQRSKVCSIARQQALGCIAQHSTAQHNLSASGTRSEGQGTAQQNMLNIFAKQHKQSHAIHACKQSDYKHETLPWKLLTQDLPLHFSAFLHCLLGLCASAYQFVHCRSVILQDSGISDLPVTSCAVS